MAWGGGSGMYKKLVELDDAACVFNSEQFDCPVCLSRVHVAGKGIVLRDCLHTFCRECLGNAIKFAEGLEVKCPFVNDDYSCDSVLQDREVRAIAPPEQFELYLKKRVAAAAASTLNSFHCRNVDCSCFCEIDASVDFFRCPSCGKQNCVACRAVHQNMTCQNYQEFELKNPQSDNLRRTGEHLQNLLQERTAMKCPKCSAVIIKTDGCNWLKCSLCQTELCWITQKCRWGPKGRGDTSGGCKCGVAGRCHPACNGCSG